MGTFNSLCRARLALAAFFCLVVPHHYVFAQALPKAYQKINVLSHLKSGKATITASPRNSVHPEDCFDANYLTMMRSANVNPAYVQLAYPESMAIKKIRVLLGQNTFVHSDENSWWVEAANTEDDLLQKKGATKW